MGRFFHRSQSGTSKRRRSSRSPDDKTTRYDVYNEEIKDYKRTRRISQSPSGSHSTSRSPPYSDMERGTRYSPQSPDSDSRDYNRNSNAQDKNGNKNSDSDADMFLYLTDSLTRLGLERKKAEKVSNKIVNCLVELVIIQKSEQSQPVSYQDCWRSLDLNRQKKLAPDKPPNLSLTS